MYKLKIALAILFGVIQKSQKIVKKCAEMLKNPKKSSHRNEATTPHQLGRCPKLVRGQNTIHHQLTTLKPTAGLFERSRRTRRIASAEIGFLPLSLMPYLLSLFTQLKPNQTQFPEHPKTLNPMPDKQLWKSRGRFRKNKLCKTNPI